jgi:hypothetical protein
MRVARAEAAGVSYREYMLELLDSGRHLQAADVARRTDPSAPADAPHSTSARKSKPDPR